MPARLGSHGCLIAGDVCRGGTRTEKGGGTGRKGDRARAKARRWGDIQGQRHGGPGEGSTLRVSALPFFFFACLSLCVTVLLGCRRLTQVGISTDVFFDVFSSLFSVAGPVCC